MKDPNKDWFKHLQNSCDIWQDPEVERKEKKNTIIVGWGLGVGAGLWVALALGGEGVAGFLVFMGCLFGSYMLTED